MRNKQYRDAYLKLGESSRPMLCLCYLLGGEDYKTQTIMNDFPEMALFEPFPGAFRWFNNNDGEIERAERLTVLAFCITITDGTTFD